MKDYTDEFDSILDSINSLKQIDLNNIPDIELYMDQITTFIDSKLRSYKRYDDDKILTKTMINNYTKDKLLPPSNKKKYSKNHIILLILIYHLKSILSINDIRTLLNSINVDSENEIENIYNDFVRFQKNQNNIDINGINIQDAINDNKNNLIFLVIQLVLQAETKKIMAEKIIDTFFINNNINRK